MTSDATWARPRQLESPGDLSQLIAEIAEAVRKGELVQLFPSGAPFATTKDIRDIAPEGPWPDYLELHFEDVRDSKRYRLTAESYHGRGGTWGELPTEG